MSYKTTLGGSRRLFYVSKSFSPAQKTYRKVYFGFRMHYKKFQFFVKIAKISRRFFEKKSSFFWKYLFDPDQNCSIGTLEGVNCCGITRFVLRAELNEAYDLYIATTSPHPSDDEGDEGPWRGL